MHSLEQQDCKIVANNATVQLKERERKGKTASRDKPDGVGEMVGGWGR